MIAITFEIHLIEPVLVMEIGSGDPNSADSYYFIPGSALRGALVSRYLETHPMATEGDLRERFLKNSTSFLNAYPLGADGTRSLPTPISWNQQKDQVSNLVRDFSAEPASESEIRFTWVECARRDPFCILFGETEFLSPQLTINIHIARQDRQRVTAAGSTVFRYQALAPGQAFGAAILLNGPVEALQNDFTELLSDTPILRIGRSSRAGYGRVEIKNVRSDSDWQENTSVDGDSPDLILTLLSDAILRHPVSGQPTTDLAAVLGMKPKSAFFRTRLVAGYNRTWNLPLPQVTALRMGSVFVFPDEPGLERRLAALQASGLGERTNEGFGRTALNWHPVAEIRELTLERGKPLPVKLAGESASIARQMAERMWAGKLEAALSAAINQTTILKPPSKSQIASLRLQLRRCADANSPQPALDFLRNLKSASEAWHNARIGTQPLFHWVQNYLEKPGVIWTELHFNPQAEPVVGGASPDLNGLALKYSLRLLDGVLHRAAKEAETNKSANQKGDEA